VLKAGKPAVCANDNVGSTSISAGNATGATRRTAEITFEEVLDMRADCA
jgi:hypothetical protein